MTRYTHRTIRSNSQWVQITRDNKARIFTFARGYENQLRAHDVDTISFKWVANWTEAIERANRLINTYA